MAKEVPFDSVGSEDARRRGIFMTASGGSFEWDLTPAFEEAYLDDDGVSDGGGVAHLGAPGGDAGVRSRRSPSCWRGTSAPSSSACVLIPRWTILFGHYSWP